jgi:hypothetical protein
LIRVAAIGDRLAMASAQRNAGLLALGIFSLMVGCQSSGAPGGFEDEAGSETADVLPPDLPQPECDPRRFDDCAPGEKCSHVLDTAFGPTNRCVELLGEGITGDACERIGESDTCANHHICWATDADGQGVCTPFCMLDLVCEGEGEICSVSSGGLVTLCLPKCHPLLPICPEGWGCYPDDYQRWACDRDQSGDAGAHGSACGCLNCCDPGLACVAGALVDAEGCGVDGAAGCCAEICDLENDAAPETVCATEAERCEAFYESSAVLMGYERVGVCEL